MIMLLGGEKGGTGKTTIAVNLAVLFCLSGKDILLIDTDKQGSTTFWANMRKKTNALFKIPCIQAYGRDIAKTGLDLIQRYEHIIIDAGGRDSMELRYSMGICNVMIIPVQPTQFDLITLGRMTAVIDQAKIVNPSMSARAILNRCSTNPTVTDAIESADVVNKIPNIRLLTTVLRERVSYQRSVREGLSVIETTPQDNKAVAEITSLFNEVNNG